MKSLSCLLRALATDCGQMCGVSTLRDLDTISQRVSKEGISFLTITLPRFAADFERSLADERIRSDLFVGFRRSKRNPRLPALLQGFMVQVFDSQSGVVRDDANENAILAIRQISLACKKMLLPCTPERVRKAIEGFVLTDHQVGLDDELIDPASLDHLAQTVQALYGYHLDGLERAVTEGCEEFFPSHGPGATAERVLANAKYESLTWTRRLERHFKACNFLLPSYGADERFLEVTWLSPREEPPVRVVTVPKTLKTPRIIAIEPVHMQYAQQAVLRHFEDILARANAGACDIRDQETSRNLAQSGSADQSFATIDLSEASDRLSYKTVQHVFKQWPNLWSLLDACRSRTADVPGYGVMKLHKWASMGSALCFPIETMVFHAIATLGCMGQAVRPSFASIRSMGRKVRTYGDDIIVPAGHAPNVINSLEAFGLKVNTAKSFWTGKFRESCGGDYYNGLSVKPTYIRRNLPQSRQNAKEMLSSVELRNQLYFAGFWYTAAWLDRYIGKLTAFPTVGDQSPALGRRTFLDLVDDGSWVQCEKLHRPLVKALVVSSQSPVSQLGGWGALMKFMIKRGVNPTFDKLHLERSGRPRSVHTRLRWSPVY